jgi:hypothetical protein
MLALDKQDLDSRHMRYLDVCVCLDIQPVEARSAEVPSGTMKRNCSQLAGVLRWQGEMARPELAIRTVFHALIFTRLFLRVSEELVVDREVNMDIQA